MSKEPICLIIANAHSVCEILVRIHICVSIPQPVLPKPVAQKWFKLLTMQFITGLKQIRLCLDLEFVKENENEREIKLFRTIISRTH